MRDGAPQWRDWQGARGTHRRGLEAGTLYSGSERRALQGLKEGLNLWFGGGFERGGSLQGIQEGLTGGVSKDS